MRPNLASVELAYREIADHPFLDAPSKKVSASFFKGNRLSTILLEILREFQLLLIASIFERFVAIPMAQICRQ